MNPKCHRALNFENCFQWALVNIQMITLLCTFTVQKYIYPSVDFEMLKAQVNGPFQREGDLSTQKKLPTSPVAVK